MVGSRACMALTAGLVCGAALMAGCASGGSASRSASASPDVFAAAFASDSSGVVRLEVSTCIGTDEGSGFLVGPDLIVTALHVVNGATSIAITGAGVPAGTGGVLLSDDPGSDAALVRSSTRIAGHLFTIAGIEPAVGSRAAAIGYPLDGSESLTEGVISGLDRSVTADDGTTHVGLIQMDVPVNPGNSGGPLIAGDGTVLGIVDAMMRDAQGINFAEPASAAQNLTNTLTSSSTSTPVPTPTCAPPSPPVPPIPSAPIQTAPPGTGAVTTVASYLKGISDHDFTAAYDLLSPDQQQRVGDEQSWAQGLSTSSYLNDQLINITTLPSGTFDVEITFTSLQDPAYGPNGQTCDNWDLDYRVVPWPDGSWRIDYVTPHDGTGYTPC